jgi:hypothetical protein
MTSTLSYYTALIRHLIFSEISALFQQAKYQIFSVLQTELNIISFAKEVLKAN